MNVDRVDQLVDLAGDQAGQGNVAQAIESLREALTLDPDSADAHAMLSVCLLSSNRLHASLKESEIALSLEPDSILALWARTVALVTNRDLKAADAAIQELLAMDPENDAVHSTHAQLLGFRGQREKQRGALERARELSPTDPSHLADLGDWHFDDGNLATAEQLADEALGIDPEHGGSHILKGQIALSRGNVAEARESTIEALRQDPTDIAALNLMVLIKARGSFLLGAWYRYQVWITAMGEVRSIAVLTAAFIVYRLSTLILKDTGLGAWTWVAHLIWLAFCVMTWLGSSLFMRQVLKETESVELHEEF